MKLCIIVGTRPEIIKTAPIIRLCEERGLDYFLLHTGQHYSHNMDRLFFEELSLRLPDYNIQAGVRNFGLQVGMMLKEIQRILAEERPDVVVVQGDTNSVLAGALAASKTGIPVGHAEAGLRSFDMSMAEELNRILTDHLSEYLFAPTAVSRQNMLDEDIDDGRIHVTGNTVVDAVLQHRELAEARSDVLETIGLEPRGYALMTLHRPECVDHEERLTQVIDGLERVGHLGMPLVFPIHPRTRKMVAAFKLDARLEDLENLRVVDPVGFLDFLRLESDARLILTDSGGVQEEACILRVPCVTLRENTERPETIRIGCNMLAGYNPDNIANAVSHLMQRDTDWKNPYGDGRAGERILDVVLS